MAKLLYINIQRYIMYVYIFLYCFQYKCLQKSCICVYNIDKSIGVIIREESNDEVDLIEVFQDLLGEIRSSSRRLRSARGGAEDVRPRRALRKS